MLVKDEQFYCEELDKSIPELSNIGEVFKKLGVKAAEKQLGDYIRKTLRPDKYFRIPYYERENKWADPSEDDYAAAERIITGEIISEGVAYKFPNGEVDWEFNPTFNAFKEWTFCLSRHHEWRCLGRCYRETGDERYAKCFIKYLMSWCKQEECPQNAKYFETKCWRTIEAGIRMTKNWHYAFYSCYKSKYMTDDVIATYLKSVWEHAERLMKCATGGNWLIMEMAGLSHIAMLYPFYKKTKMWGEFAFEKLQKQIAIQIYPDGFQYELSTNYHNVVLQNYYWVINTARAMEYDIPDAITKGIEKMFDIYMYLVQPDGRMPDLNDGARSEAKNWLKIGSELFPYRKDYRYFATDGKEGTAPDFENIVLQNSGMAVMRTGWDEKDIWFFMESAPFGRGHQHEDKLNVLMYAYGKDVLRDMGIYAYDPSDMRRYVLDTRSHNCAMIDDKSQNRRKNYRWTEDDITKLSDIKWDFAPDRDVVEGTYNEGYGPDSIRVTHLRKAIFFKKGLSNTLPFVVIVDRFVSDDGQAHKYSVSYQMDVQKYDINGNTFTSDFDDGVTMSIIGNVEPEVIKGQKSPLYMGWRPRGYYNSSEDLEHHPAPCLRYNGYGTEKRIVTVLYPSDNGVVAVKNVVISDDYSDSKIKLMIEGGEEIIIDENDYIASADSKTKYKK